MDRKVWTGLSLQPVQWVSEAGEQQETFVVPPTHLPGDTLPHLLMSFRLAPPPAARLTCSAPWESVPSWRWEVMELAPGHPNATDWQGIQDPRPILCFCEALSILVALPGCY